jgi:lipopolysaccharide/colanic/teichoic acid biosynthesis glycosyltransferase
MTNKPISYTTDEPAVRRKKRPHISPAREGSLMYPAAQDRPPLHLYRSPYARLKRAADLVLAVVMLVPALPVMLLAMAVVRLTSRGPAIYVQTRLGRGGVPFRIFKIRTMVHECESLTGPRWAIPGDPRITPIGALLRATHVDELPQLWNVIRGDMSLIGPRPERPEIAEQLVTDIPRYYERLAVKPGITGLAQVQLPPDTEVKDVADKLVLDLAYIEKIGAWLDVRLLFCTALKMLTLRPEQYRSLIKSAIPTDFSADDLYREPRAAHRRVA